MKNQITLTSIILALSCFALVPKTQALTPPPDGCYPGFTTAEGCNALSHLTSGAANTGLGWYALFGTSTGNYNTGVGAGALVLNNSDSNTAVGTAALLLNTAGTGTAPLEQPRWSITTTVPTIPLWARSRCKPTLTEATTLQWAARRFKIALAITLPLLALERVQIQVSSATMSISAIPVFPAMRM